MSTDEQERDDAGEDIGDQDEERYPGGEPPRERDETEVDPEAGENPS